MEKYGFVYCLINEGMPGLYKIGSTSKAPQNRADELSMATGVPDEFCVVCYIECENFRQTEKLFHSMLDEYRSNSRREFFKVDLQEIVALFFYYRKALSWVDRIAYENIGCKAWELNDPFEVN